MRGLRLLLLSAAAAGAMPAGLVAATPAARAGDAPAGATTEAARPEAEAQVSVLGRVTYASVDVDVPVSAHASIVPTAEILHLSPVASDPRREVHPYIGLGVSTAEADDWDWTLAATFGPRAAGIASAGLSAEVSKGLRTRGGTAGAAARRGPAAAPGESGPGGARNALGRGGAARVQRDDEGPAAPTDPDWELSLAADATLYSWQPPSPLGRGVTQLALEAGARGRLSARVRLRLQAMLFAYDRSLAARTADDVDAQSVLARVGTYAPRAFAGARISWSVSAAIAPLIEIDELAYAAGAGTATRIAAGLRVDLGRRLHVSLAAGILHNRLNGVAAGLDDQRTVPLLDVEARVLF